VTITSKLLGPPHELHAERVGELVLKRHVGEFALVQRPDHLVPENARFHHIALVDDVTLLRPLAREVEGDASDALDLIGVVDLGVDAALLARCRDR